MNIIDGRTVAEKVRADLKEKIFASIVKPGLGVILVGDDPASHLYVSLKEKACQETGIHFEKYFFSAASPEEDILQTIEQLNEKRIIHGILVQLPLPAGFDTAKIISAINPQKDVDGFHPKNTQLLFAGTLPIEPVLAKAIWELIKITLGQRADITERRLNCLIIGNSDSFTEPLEVFLGQKGLTASHIHPQRLNKEIIKQFDIVIVAVGQPNFLRGEDFKDGAIVVDVGVNRLSDGRIGGDVDFESSKKKVGWITPVPGGVGPLTVAMLLENVYLLAQKQI